MVLGECPPQCPVHSRAWEMVASLFFNPTSECFFNVDGSIHMTIAYGSLDNNSTPVNLSHKKFKAAKHVAT